MQKILQNWPYERKSILWSSEKYSIQNSEKKLKLIWRLRVYISIFLTPYLRRDSMNWDFMGRVGGPRNPKNHCISATLLGPNGLGRSLLGFFISKNITRFKAFAEQFSNSGGIGNWSIPSEGYFSTRRDAWKECGKLCKYEKRKSYGSDTRKRGVMFC